MFWEVICMVGEGMRRRQKKQEMKKSHGKKIRDLLDLHSSRWVSTGLPSPF